MRNRKPQFRAKYKKHKVQIDELALYKFLSQSDEKEVFMDEEGTLEDGAYAIFRCYVYSPKKS